MKLLENIPRDLLTAYQHAEKAAKGGRNPTSRASDHYEVRGMNRRAAKWDYGKSSYEELTAQEAIDFLELDRAKTSAIAAKLPQLRFLFGGRLAEWENHDGKIYYLYNTWIPWEKLRRIGSQGFKSNESVNSNETKWAKTARDIAACIGTADKIYKTDEYEHSLASYWDERAMKNIEYTPGSVEIYGRDASVPDYYNPHHPGQNYELTRQPQGRRTPDTGKHGQDRALNPELRRAILIKNEVKHSLINAKNAYKKLLREKDTYDEEEFSERQKKLQHIIKLESENYEKVLGKYFKARAKHADRYVQKVAEFQERVAEYLHKWEDLLTLLHTESINYEKLVSNTADSTENSTVSRLKNAVNTLKNKISEKVSIARRLEAIGGDLNDTDLQDSDEELLEWEARLETAQETLENAEQEQFKDYVQKVHDLENKLQSATSELQDLRKRETEERAKRAAKNRKVELDPELTNIIQFDEEEKEGE